MVKQLPKLHFINDKLPVHMKTDASDYAIGAYLYQVVSDNELPIAFMSKALSKQQCNWTTFEKEAYAIYMAMQEFEYLIYDKKIMLWTDHANLTYIRNSNSQKVIRWKVAFQGYLCTVKHVQGKHNRVADYLSRSTEEAMRVKFDLDDTSQLMHVAFDRSDMGFLGVLWDNDRSQELVNDVQTLEEHDRLQFENEIAMEEGQPESMIAVLQLKTIPDDIYSKIRVAHNDVVGHHGVARTLSMLKTANIDFEFRASWVRQFISQCPYCQKMREQVPEVQAQHYTVANTTPMSQISVDAIGAMPTSRKGNQHILVFIDNFSRFVELYPTPSVEAKEAARCMLNFTGRYGVPLEVVSDKGSQFVNDLIQEFVAAIGTNQLLTIPHSKEQNAIVERANKEILRKLKFITLERQNTGDWDEYLPITQRIMNASVHSMVGTTPASILFGNAIDLDRAILFPQHEVSRNASQPVRKYML
jgi:hypothetical protein